MAKQPEDPTKPLKNLRHERFVLEVIINNGNNAAAYRAVFPRSSFAASDGDAARVMARPEVKARMNHIRTEAFKKAHMDADEVLSWVAQRVRVDISECYWRPGELDGAGNPISSDQVGTRKPLYLMPEHVRRSIKKIKHTEFGVEIEMMDPASREQSIMKHHKLIDSEMNLNIHVGIADKLRAARERRLARIKEQKKK